jgi:hypothetical protein
MNVTSSTQTQYTQTTATQATSAYESATPIEQNSTIDTSSDAYLTAQNSEVSVVNRFLEDIYSKSSTATASAITKETLQNKVNEYAQALMQARGDTLESESDVSKMLNDYKKELLQDYKESLDGATNDNMTLEQQAIIKVLLDENTQEASSLEKLLATKKVAKTNSVTATSTTAATDNVTKTEATDKLAEMQEKYKDIYTPIPETYSVKDEELQARKIYEAYPNYISGPDFLQIVSSFLEGTRIELGQKLTPAQEEAQKLDYAQAFQKAYDIFGGEEEFITMQKGVQAIKEQYPINEWAKQGYADNSKELARFKNAAIYEGLERGLSLESATKAARNAEYMFMDTSYASKMLDDMLIKAGRMSPAPEGGRETVKTEVNFDHPNNGTMDLRAYGIDGAWNTNEVIENQKDMLQEIEKKISQFNFMLNNKELIKEAIMKLPADARGVMNNEGYESWINKELMPRMQLGYEVFSKYQIYDN